MNQIPPQSARPFPASFGWSSFFQENLDKLAGRSLIVGRVTGQARDRYEVQTADNLTIEAAINSKLRRSAKGSVDFPAVGDWVTLVQAQSNERSTIQHIMQRKNSIERKRAGTLEDVQLIAANIDFMLVVSSCNEDFDLERLGRYFDLGKECACPTALLLTKVDQIENAHQYIDQVKAKFGNIEIVPISNQDPETLLPLKKFFAPGTTSLLVGSSGVGKSTLTNYLLGHEAQKTQGVSSAAKGRHTTTARYLRMTKWGGLVIDTPGMQEVNAQGDSESALNRFSDVEQTALNCKFTNCQHKSEPGCKVKEALKAGSLSLDRWNEYLAAVAKNESKEKLNAKTGRRSKSYSTK